MNIKPVYLMHDDCVTANQMNAVKAGLLELLQIVGARDKINVHNFGVWKHSDWKAGGKLAPYMSIDWYIEQGRVEGRQQLQAGAILNEVCREPWQSSRQHYDVVVLSQDIYAPGTNFVIGLAQPGVGTILSMARWKNFSASDQFELIKTETMHEFGHVANLPNINRKDIEQKLGGHCLNTCVMRQGMTVPHDWIKITNDRLEHGPLCPICKKDLANHFH